VIKKLRRAHAARISTDDGLSSSNKAGSTPEQIEGGFMIELFVVYTKDKVCGFKNVPIRWAIRDRGPRPLQPYESVITGYGTLKGLRRREAEDCVDQFLTADEARQIADHLIANWCGAKPEILPVELPIPKGSALPSYRLVSKRPKSRFRFLFPLMHPNYTLPFKVDGLVDTDGCVPHNEEDPLQEMIRRASERALYK
jgi:hypothetical protein